MRRTPNLRQENQLALALAEIERLKSITTRVTDGRVIVTIQGSDPGAGEVPPLATSEHVLFGSKHTNSFFVTAAEGISLTIFIQAGQVWAGGTFRDLAATTLQMTDATTNYVYVSAAGAITSNVVSFPADGAALATVVTAGGDITSVNDRRSYLTTGGAVVGSLHDADQIIDDDGDTSVEVERGVDDDTIRFKAATVDVALITSAGQWQLPVIGSGAGIRMGGDTLLYRSAADILMLGAGDTFAVGDADYLLAMTGGNPRITLDADDYWEYNRASNYYEWVIDSVQQMLMGDLGGAGIFDGSIHQMHFPMVADQDILIDGATNPRTIDTGMMRFEQVPAIPDTRALTVNVNANSQPGTHAIVVNMTATAIAAGEVISAYDVNLIAGNSSGGIMRAFEVSMVGTGIAADALHCDPGVSPLTHHSGSFINVESAWANAVDVTASFNSAAVDATLFAANGDVVTIGMDAPFDDIEVILATAASGAGVKPTFEYSTGGPGWTVFAASDETIGFRQGGLISWEIGDLAGWATQADNGVDKYWIRITRTQVGLTTPPIEDTIQVQAVTEYGWDAIGDVTIRNLNLLQGYIQLEDMPTPAVPAFGDMHFFTRISGSRIQLIGQGPTGEECVICDVSNVSAAANILTLNWIE